MPTADKPTPITDNPHGDDFRKMTDDGRRYKVNHTAVGMHREAAVVSARDLGPGAELNRLIELGAISEMSPSEIQAHEEALKAGVQPTAKTNEIPVIRPTGGGPAGVAADEAARSLADKPRS